MSAPMISWVPIVNRIYKYLTTSRSRTDQAIDIPSVAIHDVETAPEKRPRTLKHLIRANHANYAILYHDLQFDNHMAHILCSAYLLGAHEDQLHHIYDEESKVLEEWHDSPEEISDQDWRDFLGDRRYQRAYVDFFEDELALKNDYHWKQVAGEYLFGGKNPLINGVISALGHPLIHLGYAYEFNSVEVGMEALGLIASTYNHLHKYLDDPSYTKPSEHPSTSPLEILKRIGKDTRFDGLFEHKGGNNFNDLFENHEDLILEYWNSWVLEDPVKQFQQSQEAAVALLAGTVEPGNHDYDFFLVHVLTTSHAVRILLPLIPAKFHLSLVRQWWLLAIAVYIAQLRPKIGPVEVDESSLKEKQWKYVDYMAVSGPWATDAHYVKALRAIKEAASTWGDEDKKYLSSAVKLADAFQGWGGFGPHDEA